MKYYRLIGARSCTPQPAPGLMNDARHVADQDLDRVIDDAKIVRLEKDLLHAFIDHLHAGLPDDAKAAMKAHKTSCLDNLSLTDSKGIENAADQQLGPKETDATQTVSRLLIEFYSEYVCCAVHGSPSFLLGMSPLRLLHRAPRRWNRRKGGWKEGARPFRERD